MEYSIQHHSRWHRAQHKSSEGNPSISRSKKLMHCRSSIQNASSHTKNANMVGNTIKSSITYTPANWLRSMNDIPVEGEYLRLKHPEWIWLTLLLPLELLCNIVGIRRGRWEVLRSGGRVDVELNRALIRNARCRVVLSNTPPTL